MLVGRGDVNLALFDRVAVDCLMGRQGRDFVQNSGEQMWHMRGRRNGNQNGCREVARQTVRQFRDSLYATRRRADDDKIVLCEIIVLHKTNSTRARQMSGGVLIHPEAGVVRMAGYSRGHRRTRILWGDSMRISRRRFSMLAACGSSRRNDKANVNNITSATAAKKTL